MNNWITLCLIALVLTACADPKYIQDETSPPAGPFEVTKAECTYKFSQQDLCVAYTWEQVATEKLPGIMILRLFQPAPMDGFPLVVDTALELKSSISMPDMNHGAPPLVVEKLAPGTFRISRMYFSIMHGAWEIKLQLVREGSVVDQVFLPYNF